MTGFVRVATGGGPRVGRWEGDSVEILDHDDPLAAVRGCGEPVYPVETPMLPQIPLNAMVRPRTTAASTIIGVPTGW